MTHDEVRVHPPAESQMFPVIGENTQGLCDYLVREKKLPNADAFNRVRRDAVAILKGCRRFDDVDGTRTGLVVGYVQSGKTLSMTAVNALARDNGCRIVILLAGVTNILLEQSAKRFKSDLRGASGKATAWRIFNSADGLGQKELAELQRAASEWKDPVFKDDAQTLLYVVLKNHSHLDQLAALLKQVDLRRIPAIVIDDEADQAGLNTDLEDAQGSTTYRKIKSVRAALPHHTYLQYTATPQAPLLIAIDSMLSPEFAELVEPGDGYTGGEAFFGANRTPGLVIAIKADDLFKPGEPPEVPPESLIGALTVFFVGCAVAEVRGKPQLRSMLVHPSPRTADHTRYLGWISEVIRRWSTTLRSKNEEDKADALDEFRGGYAELGKTDGSLPPFEELVQPLLVSLSRVSVKEVNSQDGSEIDWQNAADHILIGGEKLNRGFTVEGLTVTYMPRDAGGWNADTIQQRARFFGYKASFLSLCRLYLHHDVIDAFEGYVRHEADIRRQLEAHRGKPLREWRRAFFLDSRMRPTRNSVLSDPYYKIPRERVWFTQRFPQEADVSANAARLKAIEAKGPFAARDGFFKHTISEQSLKEIYEALVAYDVRDGDVASWYGQLVTIGDIVENDPTARVLVVRMEGSDSGVRFRTPEASGEIKLHQGRSSSKNKADKYPGDKEIHAPGLVTLQLSWIDVAPAGSAQAVPAIAVHIPATLRRDDVGAMG